MRTAWRRPGRYASVARAYDLVSAEPVYRRGRRLAITALALRPGDTVLDLGCGTGLSFPLLSRAVGPGGRIVGVDASPQMLAEAARRTRRPGGPEVILVACDATALDPEDLRRTIGGQVDAAVAIYALSLMPRWGNAFHLAHELTRHGGRIAVVDMQRPSNRLLRPPAWAAMGLGGADPDAHPWQAVEESCLDVVAPTRPGAHVQVRVGARHLDRL